MKVRSYVYRLGGELFLGDCVRRGVVGSAHVVGVVVRLRDSEVVFRSDNPRI